MKGWWQNPNKKQKNEFVWRVGLTVEEYAMFHYLTKHLNISMGQLVKLALAEWIENRVQARQDMQKQIMQSTWDRIQQHMKSGKWHGLPDKLKKVTKDKNLDPAKYAAAAYCYGVHPDLAQLLTDYANERATEQSFKAIEQHRQEHGGR